MSKKYNFADQPTITTTYAGELAQAYISAALLSGKTLSENLIQIKENVKYKGVLKTLASSGLISTETCDFTPGSSAVTLAEQVIEPKNLQVNLQLCKQPFREDWEAMQTGGLRVDAVIPPNFETFLLLHVAGKIGQDVENNIWQGDTTAAANNSFDGLFKQSQAIMPGANILTGADSPSDILKVLDVFEKLREALPAQLLFHPDLRLYVSPATASAYIHALGAANYQFESFVGVKPLNYDGIQIEIANGMEATKCMLTLNTNLFFGTNLMGDFNEAKVLDMGNLDGSDNVRVVYRFTGGTQVAIGADVITYAKV